MINRDTFWRGSYIVVALQLTQDCWPCMGMDAPHVRVSAPELAATRIKHAGRSTESAIHRQNAARTTGYVRAYMIVRNPGTPKARVLTRIRIFAVLCSRALG